MEKVIITFAAHRQNVNVLQINNQIPVQKVTSPLDSTRSIS